ncbi:MAG TPA: sugar ABC transporter substrate-binding protein [Ktedonobacteraceae bacterium]|nr:sugar ABC transporter substrate-binding protein [Ktedonobacteraceae bacterium]
MVQGRSLSSISRRRFLQSSGAAVGAAALGSSFLAACAGTGSSSGNSSLPTLQQWYHQYGETGTHEAVLRYAKTFKKANINVSWIAGTGNAYPDKVRASLLGSNPPDVFELSGISVDMVKAGQLEPLDDIIADVKSDFLPADLVPYTVDGKVYGIKMLSDPTFIYYRKSLFQKAGITQPPTTVDELITVTKKLSSGSMKGLYLGPDGGVSALAQIAGWSTGGDFLSSDNKVTFNTDRFAAVYEKIYQLNASGAVLPDAPTFWWDPSSFTQGLCAMQWCGLWAMPGITQALGDDFGIFPWPALDAQGQPATVNGGWAEFVAGKGKNKDLAKEYVKSLWVDSTSTQIDWNVGYGFHVPPRASIAQQTTKLQSSPASDAVNLLNKYGHAMPVYWNAAMETALENAMASIVKDGKNALSLLNQAADKCNTEIQNQLK